MSAKFVVRRNTLKGIINRAIGYANSVNADTPIVEIQTRLQLLDSTFERILNVQIEINALTGAEAIEFEDIEFDAIQALYEAAKIKLTTELQTRVPDRNEGQDAAALERFRLQLQQQQLQQQQLQQQQPHQQQQRMEIKLPHLQIPKFNGDYTLWTSFRDLFQSSIGNRNSLTGSQKLHYLKSFLEDDAAQLVRSYQVTDANFDVAWEALDNRYNNKRLLISAQFKKLFGQVASTSESAASIRKLMDTTTECVRALNALDLPTEHWSSIIVFIVSQRLEAETHKQWELSLTHNDIPTYEQLTTFMEQRCRSLEAAGKLNASSPSSNVKKPTASSSKPKASFHVNTGNCRMCSGDHSITNCEKFKKLRVYDRRNFVQRQHLCFNCFDSQHLAPDCNKTSCNDCSGKHHSLLHYERKATDEKPKQVVEPAVTTHFGEMEAQVLLSTAWVKVFGTNEKLRVLLDSGSQASFITEDCVQRLRLSRKSVSIPVSGLGASNAGKANAMVCFQIQSCIDDNFVVELKALVLKQLTGMLPGKEIASENRSKYSGIVLADPEYFRPGHIDMLIGADIYGKLLLDGLIPGNGRVATAQNTSLGWILLGAVPDRQQSSKICNVSSVLNMHLSLEADLRKFWEIEEVNVASSLTRAEEKCELYFDETHSRDDSGRYVVRIPFDDSVGALGNSRNSAVKRLIQVEKRLCQNDSMKQQYHEFMREYAALGHMQLASQWLNSDDNGYYLPHHCVIKESSSTTKLRVVFDASCKTSTGISLNDKQLIGPKLQDDLFSIVVRFRQHAIALTADIAKMYRQVLVDERDVQYQRIVWRENVNDDISDWILKTVTYGMASAPYLAIRSLRQLAIDESSNFPVASNVVLSDFYVDDMLTGCESVEEAMKLQTDLKKLLCCGGFELRKWSSNNHKLLNLIPAELRESDGPLSLSEDVAVKTLGLNWHPNSDSFGFLVKVPDIDELVTKRAILSVVARLFDPLGFLSPTIVVAKMLLQQLWTLGIGWDEEVPSDIRCHWLAYCGALMKLEAIRIPRWLGTKRHQQCEIHAFCDASEAAYGAVVYAKCLMDDETVRISLISAKSKVAPIKQQTLPRLELCAAVLLTRLVEYVEETLKLDGVNYYAWSDSQVVLSWLRKIPRTWKTFVANRVATIQLSAVPMKWRYVPSESNPADCASRGVMPQDLKEHPLWLSGPDWLRFDETCWPKTACPTNDESTEKREVKALAAIIPQEWDILANYSNLLHLKRVTAYILRFIANIRCRRTHEEMVVGELTAEELKRALRFWLARVQSIEFASELAQCKRGEPLKRSSKLLSLNPFVDAEGLLRVGGRLKFAMLDDQANPIILPQKNSLTNLIIADIHIKLLHGGIQMMLGYLRRSYWIVGARSRIRQFIHRCVVCFRQKPKTCQQMMGDLPAERVTACRPFQRSGVDYAGPILLKSSNGRGNRTIKAYIALFVCFATKAVHIEVVSDLTTSAFLAAFKRFTARRGKCSDVFSDCGTNFIGAKREIGEIQSLLRSRAHQDAVCRLLADDGTRWHLIPPGSPHFGGLWEAGVKSVKHHLRRIVGQQRLTFEEMTTTLTEIEACLNSRPLCAQTDDPEDLTALTPGHFLIGEAPMVKPDLDITDVPVNRLTRWKLVNQITQRFWQRWNQEYITTLQQRPKWREPHANVQVGQLALIKDERLPPAKWLLCRITATHTGADGKIRVADVKYNGGTTSRTINKLCILPIE